MNPRFVDRLFSVFFISMATAGIVCAGYLAGASTLDTDALCDSAEADVVASSGSADPVKIRLRTAEGRRLHRELVSLRGRLNTALPNSSNEVTSENRIVVDGGSRVD